jgi:hypothetical protein
MTSLAAAAELAGCDHHTVARYVRLWESGQSPVAREHRARPIDEYLDKIEELVTRSGGRVRADVVHARILAMGFTGGERTTRRAVAQVKDRFRSGRRRVFRPWIPEPGLWMQWDWGEGPRIGGRRTLPHLPAGGVGAGAEYPQAQGAYQPGSRGGSDAGAMNLTRFATTLLTGAAFLVVAAPGITLLDPIMKNTTVHAQPAGAATTLLGPDMKKTVARGQLRAGTLLGPNMKDTM